MLLGVDLTELQGIASAPTNQNVLTVQTFDDVAGLAQRLASGLCNSEYTRITFSFQKRKLISI